MHRFGLLAGLMMLLAFGVKLPGDETLGVKPRFTVSRKTTFLVSPLRKNGSIDYAAAINTQMSDGVTPQNNACVPLYQAFGPAPDKNKLPATFFQELGIPVPHDDGTLLQLSPNFVDDQHLRTFYADLSVAMSRPWQRSEFPRVSDWLDQNEQPLRKIADAARCERYYSPLITNRDDPHGPIPLALVWLPGVQQSRSVARMLIARSMLQLGEDHAEAAWNDLLTCHRLGRLIGTGATIIEGLVGLSLGNLCVEAELTFLRETRPTSAQARQYRFNLYEMPSIARMSETVKLFERCQAIETLSAIAMDSNETAKILPKDEALTDEGMLNLKHTIDRIGIESIDWDLALVRTNQWFDRAVAAMESPNYAERKAAMAQLTFELSTLKSTLLNPDAFNDEIALDAARGSQRIGDWMASMMLSVIVQAQTAETRARQREKNLDMALALAAFHADHAHYPERLAELRPKYMTSRIEDLFTGLPPIYRRQGTGYLLYSVGENAQDDSGQTFGENPTGDDLPIRVEN